MHTYVQRVQGTDMRLPRTLTLHWLRHVHCKQSQGGFQGIFTPVYISYMHILAVYMYMCLYIEVHIGVHIYTYIYKRLHISHVYMRWMCIYVYIYIYTYMMRLPP